MIDENTAKLQIKRLSGLSFFPQEPSAIKELVIALRCAETPEAAGRVVDDFLAVVNECPKPADIRRAIYQAEEAEQNEYAVPTITKCNACGDTGWKQIVKDGYEFAERCGCRA